MHRVCARVIFNADHSVNQLSNKSKRAVFVQLRLASSDRVLKHNERKLVRVPPEVMYATVKEVDNYKNFVPYCFSSVVTSETANSSHAKLSVGFGPITENYTSRLRFERPLYVEALCSDGKLFNSLNCMWNFKPVRSPDMCIIDFHVDFEFRSAFYSQIATLFFNEVVKKMVASFEAEAKRQMALRSNEDLTGT